MATSSSIVLMLSTSTTDPELLRRSALVFNIGM